ncbi:MAG: methyltransferase [Candidatus Aenigmarchaeota archaeon]|nr:methyltransferase [Candidatus Aenigmarchaeota archaeon]
MNLKTALEGKIPKDAIKNVSSSFEMLGDIALIEVPKEILKHEKIIAKTLAEINSNINIVLSKIQDVEGLYRVPKYKVVFENKTPRDFSWVPKDLRPKSKTETVHKENGIRLLLDPTKAYFSEKLAYERNRIAADTNNNEKILVMFAGVGPFPIILAKKKNVKLDAVEINPEAIPYFKKNVILNKLESKIIVHEGDVAKIVPKLENKYDRIVMPAPKNAQDFLEIALNKINTNGTIHLYTFLPEEEIATISKKIIKRCKKYGHEIEIKLVRKCGNIGPFNYRVVVDFKVLN